MPHLTDKTVLGGKESHEISSGGNDLRHLRMGNARRSGGLDYRVVWPRFGANGDR
jgi:hypothetical protein